MMGIGKRVIERLEKLVSHGPEQAEAVILDSARQQGYIVGVPAKKQGPSVVLTLQDYDRYSVTLRNLEVSHKRPLVNGRREAEDYLRHCAGEIARRLTYLENPLVLLELDAGQGLAQLRTDPPQPEGDEEATYWEAFVRVKPHPKISLAYYRWTPGRHERELLAYPATLATLGRIATDLALSLSGEAE